MRLSKKALTVLVSGVFAVLIASLLMAYFEHDREQSRLSEELSTTQQLLTKQAAKFSVEELSYQQKELESQLAQVESQLGTARTNLRQSIESIEVTDTIFEAAETSAVEIVEISSAGLTSGELREVSFSVLPLTVRVKGDVTNLIDFSFKLSQRFPTSMDERVEIEIGELISEATLPTLPTITDGELELWSDVNNLTYWTESTSGTGTVDRSTTAYEGNYSACLTCPISSSAEIYQDLSNWSDDFQETYVLISFWAMATKTGLSAPTAQVKINDGLTDTTEFVPVDDAWHLLTVRKQLGSSASRIRVIGTASTPEDTTVNLFVDNVQIEALGTIGEQLATFILRIHTYEGD